MRKAFSLPEMLIVTVILGILATIGIAQFMPEPTPEEVERRVVDILAGKFGPESEWLDAETGDLVIFPGTGKRTARHYIFLVASGGGVLFKNSAHSTTEMRYSMIPYNAEIIDQDDPRFNERCPDHLK